MTVFEFSNYKAYLRHKLTPGTKKTFSSFIQCLPSFLSQVLNQSINLSLEQGALANEYFEHSENEGRHFLLLLQLDRSGSHKLNDFFRREIENSLEAHNKVHKRIIGAKSLREESKHIYYSDWIFSAIHILASLPSENQMDLFKRKTKGSKERIQEVLDFLQSAEVIKFLEGRYVPTQNQIHLDSTDRVEIQLHKNFRLKVIQQLSNRNKQDLHYSSLLGISLATSQLIKSELLNLLEKVHKEAGTSKEEECFQLGIDFFKI